jgi:hypothetical protein
MITFRTSRFYVAFIMVTLKFQNKKFLNRVGGRRGMKILKKHIQFGKWRECGSFLEQPNRSSSKISKLSHLVNKMTATCHKRETPGNR